MLSYMQSGVVSLIFSISDEDAIHVRRIIVLYSEVRVEYSAMTVCRSNQSKTVQPVQRSSQKPPFVSLFVSSFNIRPFFSQQSIYICLSPPNTSTGYPSTYANIITNIKLSIVKPKRVKMSFSFAITLISKLIALDTSQLSSASWNKQLRADRGKHENCRRKGDVCDSQIHVMEWILSLEY